MPNEILYIFIFMVSYNMWERDAKNGHKLDKYLEGSSLYVK